MKDNEMREQIKHTLNTELAELSTSSLQRDHLYQNAIGGERMNRKFTATFRCNGTCENRPKTNEYGGYDGDDLCCCCRVLSSDR